MAFFCVRMQTGNGVDLVVHELARRLVSDYGHDVDVWTPTSDGTYEHEPYRLRKLYVYGAQWNRFQVLHELNAYKALRKLGRQLHAEGGGYDLVVPCTHPYYGAGDALGAPSLFFNFGNVPTTGFSWRGRLNFAWLDISESWFHKHRAAKVVSISRFLHGQQSAEIQRKGCVLHLAGDHYGVHDDLRRAEFRRRLGVGEGDVLLGYCGRLFRNYPEYKGTHRILELGRRLRQRDERIRLVMCGAGDAADAQWIRDGGALPLTYLPAADMPGFYDALDIYVCASRWEGFNLPIVEAAWHGVPSVAYDAGAHAEHVTSVLAPDGDFDALCDAAASLASDAQLREQQARDARRRAEGFAWEAVARRFEELAREAAG